jgi:hypothetical protein
MLMACPDRSHSRTSRTWPVQISGHLLTFIPSAPVPEILRRNNADVLRGSYAATTMNHLTTGIQTASSMHASFPTGHGLNRGKSSAGSLSPANAAAPAILSAVRFRGPFRRSAGLDDSCPQTTSAPEERGGRRGACGRHRPMFDAVRSGRMAAQQDKRFTLPGTAPGTRRHDALRCLLQPSTCRDDGMPTDSARSLGGQCRHRANQGSNCFPADEPKFSQARAAPRAQMSDPDLVISYDSGFWFFPESSATEVIGPISPLRQTP